MKWLPLAAAFVVSVLLLPGCGGSNASVTMSRQAPTLRSVLISPEDLRFTYAGGTVTLLVQVESQSGIRAVTAERQLLDSPIPETKLYPLIPAGDAYQTSFQVPSNVSATGKPVRYKLSVYAEDSVGSKSDRVEYEIRVAPPDSSDLPTNPTF